MPTSFLERYARLTVPDRSRLTGRSFSRLVILPAMSMRKRSRTQEKKEKKNRARRRDRNHILHYDTVDESRTRGLPQPPIAHCTLTGSWCHSVFPFWKERYPWPRHLPTLRPTERGRVAFSGLVRPPRRVLSKRPLERCWGNEPEDYTLIAFAP